MEAFLNKRFTHPPFNKKITLPTVIRIYFQRVKTTLKLLLEILVLSR